jgi:hypothetical protein
MGAALLQLVAYGAQDAYISGNPQITFWKGLFKRHTNFAMEPFRINFSGQIAWGTKQTALVGRHADLLYSTYVEVALPKTKTNNTPFTWNNTNQGLGFHLIKYAEIDVGGQVIDRLYGEYMYLWSRLSLPTGPRASLTTMLCADLADGPVTLPHAEICTAEGRKAKMNVFYIPLPFFFTRNPGAALPLIALQYHEVKINVYWNDPEFITGSLANANSVPPAIQAALYIDYIYLDTEERRRMAQASHEYLIEQTQYNEEKGIRGASNRVDLTFNHPVKELLWVVQESYKTDCRKAAANSQPNLKQFDYSVDPVFDQWIQINGQDRLDKRYGSYFSSVQAFQHHSGSPAGVGAYSYSFAIRPEEHQPSGTCNFSRIDTATIVINMSGDVTVGPTQADNGDWDVRVYATNYNVLRVMSGMGGLAYSN